MNRKISKMLKNVAMALCTLQLGGLLLTAHASDDISLGTPDMGGSGCNPSNSSVTLSPDSKEISILFDQYIAEAGGSTNRKFDRKTCNLTIPVHVPQGMSVSVLQVDYRGFSNIPDGGQGAFNVEYFFAGIRGPRASKIFTSRARGNYILTNKLEARAMVWSRCGDAVNLRVNSSILATTNRANDQTMLSVDTMDVSAEIVFKVQWKSCR